MTLTRDTCNEVSFDSHLKYYLNIDDFISTKEKKS